jgi:CheY-like chemotaxis protein
MKTTLNSLVATYQILLMTINRCTDYTKTSHRINLVPTLETINLVESSTAPLSCVEELQGRVKVETTVDSRINDYIITDRQWLQDNLLCLVSNAVKYSEESTIATVKMTLVEMHCMDAINSFDGNAEQQRVNKHANVDLVRHDSNTRLSVRFEVEDTGFGLHFFDNKRTFEQFNEDEIEEMRKLFQEPDFSKRKELGGSGLGLHCLAKRVEALRGEYGIRPRNDKTHGALFWFSVPYVPVSSLKGSLQKSNKSASGRSEGHIRRTSESYTSPVLKWFENESVIGHAHQRKSSSVTSFMTCLSGLEHLSLERLSQQNANRKTLADIKETGEVIEEYTGEGGSGRGAGLGVTGLGGGGGLQTMMKKKSSFSLRESETSTHGRGFRDSSMDTEGPFTRTGSPKSFFQPASSKSTKTRLLVVDDSLPILKMLRIMLEKNGFEVVTATNGAEALQYFQKSFEEKVVSEQHGQPAFDGILMDLQMPVMGGIEAIGKIRGYERYAFPEKNLFRHHLIVAMSAGNDDETLEAVYKAGADEFLSKPFNLQAFKNILQDFHQRTHITLGDEVLRRL